jgi:hypothetical protein
LIGAGGVERDVRFAVPEPGVADQVSAAYHATYDRYGPAIVGSVVSAEAVRSTLSSRRDNRSRRRDNRSRHRERERSPWHRCALGAPDRCWM